jgi:hypothetical protein
MGPKPHQEAALEPGPSLGRVGDGAQQRPAGAEVVHPSGPLAGVCRGFSVSRRVASRRSVSTALGWEAMEILAPHFKSSASSVVSSSVPGVLRLAHRARVPPSRSTKSAAPPAASAEQALQFAETLARSCSRALGETVAGVILPAQYHGAGQLDRLVGKRSQVIDWASPSDPAGSARCPAPLNASSAWVRAALPQAGTRPVQAVGSCRSSSTSCRISASG